jgi:diaminopimelate epimerase
VDSIVGFHKYHALGNDYIVIDPQKARIDLSPEAIRLICHRNYGIGSDGILFGPIFEGGAIRLRIFNPDGSEAEKSGNGIRIFSRYLDEAGYVKSGRFELMTKGGPVVVEVPHAKASLIRVDMGIVTFQSDRIPMTGAIREVVDELLELDGVTYRITCLSIGNPHCVIPVDTMSPEAAKKLGPLVENHPMFPNRINMQLMKILDRNTIRIEIWERGAGYTLASGSSSCAAASAAFRLGLVDRSIDVHMPGGTISIEIGNDGHVHMTGPVEGIAQGAFSHDMRARIMHLKGRITE